MSAAWTPVTPDDLAGRLTAWLTGAPGLVRVAVDGPAAGDPAGLADSIAALLPAAGRPAGHVQASSFWRDASVRLEYGREDVESYRSWLDADALQREVLAPAVAEGWYLPTLRDPLTNRSTRAERVRLEPGTVLVVSGPLLLGLGLPFDRTIHVTLSPAARARRTPPSDAWTLPAFDDYDASVRPAEIADVVIKVEDARHPAVRGLPG